MIPVVDSNGATILAADDYLKPDTTAAQLAALKPAFADIGAMGADEHLLKSTHATPKLITFIPPVTRLESLMGLAWC